VCADISSVFVSVARAAESAGGEVFGLRLGKKDDEDMTAGITAGRILRAQIRVGTSGCR